MTKTSLEVVAEAHRRINVLSVDEEPSADMVSYGQSVLEAVLAEETVSFTSETVPDDVYKPLAWLVAADLAVHHERPAEARGKALYRFHGAIYPNDMTDRRDVDEDGSISEAEEYAGLRAGFY